MTPAARRALETLRGPLLRPFWTLVGIRCAFWVGTALALVWTGDEIARGELRMRAYGPLSDILFGAFGVWDAVWFVELAQEGYHTEKIAAFFPLYPLVTKAVAVVVGPEVVAGTLVSLVAAGIGAVLVAELARPLLGADGARYSVLLLALYPVSFVFTAAYSDALFLAVAAGAFLAARERRVWTAALLVGLAVATRPLGVALVLPVLLLLLPPRGERSPRAWAGLLPVVLAPVLALGAYAAYLHHRLGNATAFVSAQEEWHRATPDFGPLTAVAESLRLGARSLAHLATELPRTGQAFEFADSVALWRLSHVLLLVAAAWLTWVAWRRFGAPYGLYSVLTMLVMLTTPVIWFPLQSFPRFLIGNFPVLLALAAVTQHRPRARQVLLVSFAALGSVACVLFARQIWIA